MLILITSGLWSCSYEDPIRSDVTEFPEMELTGEPYIFLNLGATFEDPGAIAKAGEENLEVSVKGAVDTEVPGVYTLTYSAKNADGFPASVKRFVAVGYKEVVEGRDLSGTYAPANTVTRLTTGFYHNSDLLPTNELSGVMVDLGNGELIIPVQSSPSGDIYADPAIDPETFGTLNADMSFTFHQMISCCGIYTRTFVKQ